ncbi:MAG: hypothetical protein L0H19_08415 [Salinisphaera sp.]|nr:hypothetical protein [Salinisphaera sp.]MDN5937955.1 hypothetical protein [Salinisphaera sp.]
MNDEQDREFAGFARTRLEHSVDEVDELTRARLAAMRARALEQAGGQPSRLWMAWVPAGAVALAAVAALSWLLATQSVATLPGDAPVSVLTAQEDLDFYRDLDFYLWLEARDARA